MIKHIVFWAIAEGADGKTVAESAQIIKEGLERLVGIVDGLRKAEVGMNLNDDKFNLCLYSEFDSMEQLEAYQTHPEHMKVREFVKKVRTDRAVVDFEV